MDNKLNNSVAEQVQYIKNQAAQAAAACGRAPGEVQIMAVTKTVAPEYVNQAIAAGITLLGENRAQELLEKYDRYNKEGVSIHFIGHLQTNKARQIIDKVDMIHSVGSLHLAQEIHRQAEKIGKVMPVLVEVNIGEEDSKSGIAPQQLMQLLEEMSKLSHISVQGLMAIPPICEKETENDQYFCKMEQLFIDIKQKKLDNVNMNILSMGMSRDYQRAIQFGANVVRLGTAIFGSRQ